VFSSSVTRKYSRLFYTFLNTLNGYHELRMKRGKAFIKKNERISEESSFFLSLIFPK